MTDGADVVQLHRRDREQLERRRPRAAARGNPRKPLCVECGIEPSVAGGRCFTCRRRSML